VMNQQRTVIYAQRLRALEEADLKDSILEMMEEIIEERVASYLPTNERWDDEDLKRLLNEISQVMLRAVEMPDSGDRHPSAEEVSEWLQERVRTAYEEKEQEISAPIMRELERQIFLNVIDEHWMDHLREMYHLREGIGLRAYGQRDPLVEYKREAFSMFEDLTHSIREETVRTLFRANLVLEPAAGPPPGAARRPERPATPAARALPRVRATPESESHAAVSAFGTPAPEGGGGGGGGVGPSRPAEGSRRAPLVAQEPKVGRNDPCPCGSGKKYKKCHGA